MKSIAIIGVGIRGSIAFERVISALRNHPNCTINIHLIEPLELGAGSVYRTTQPDHFLMNTICSELTVFTDDTCLIQGSINKGPNLYEWIKLLGGSLGSNDYPPRNIFGKYLNWHVLNNISKSPPNVKIYHHKTQAIDVSSYGQEKRIHLANNRHITADHILITIGDSSLRNNLVETNAGSFTIDQLQSEDYHAYSAYPADCYQNNLSSHNRVLILGMGLSMIDVVIALTVGKGGGFTRHSGNLLPSYKSSGREPNLTAFSRSGIPLAARAINQKDRNERYYAKYITKSWVDSLIVNQGFVDFEKDLFPLIIKECKAAFAESVNKGGKPSTKRFDEFSWQSISNPLGQIRGKKIDQDKYIIKLFDFLKEDLLEASKGNVFSPFKAACDSLRDIRDPIRYAVEYGQLSKKSLAFFFNSFSSIHNRIAVGPPFTRSSELLKLYMDKFVDLSFGPYPEISLDEKNKSFVLTSTIYNKNKSMSFDTLIDGRVPKKKSMLIENLIIRGLARTKKIFDENQNLMASPLDCTRSGFLVNTSGQVDESLSLLGQPAEGILWYTFVAARPNVNSRALSDADVWAQNILQKIIN